MVVGPIAQLPAVIVLGIIRESVRVVNNAFNRNNKPVAAGCVFFSGVRIRLGMIFNYLILWVRVKGQG